MDLKAGDLQCIRHRHQRDLLFYGRTHSLAHTQRAFAAQLGGSAVNGQQTITAPFYLFLCRKTVHSTSTSTLGSGAVAELLGSEPNSKRGKPGPTPQLQLRFDQIRRLPRKEQEFVIRFIDTVLEKAQKA